MTDRRFSRGSAVSFSDRVEKIVSVIRALPRARYSRAREVVRLAEESLERTSAYERPTAGVADRELEPYG